MQRRLNQKLSAALKSENETEDGRSTRSSRLRTKSSELRRREQKEREKREEQELEEETPLVSPEPEYEDPQLTFQSQEDFIQQGKSSQRASRASLARARSHSSGSRSSQQRQVEFYNNRLGAFLPGPSADVQRSSSADEEPDPESDTTGFFGGELNPQDSKGFALENEDEDEEVDLDDYRAVNRDGEREVRVSRVEEDYDVDYVNEEEAESERVPAPARTSSSRRSRSSNLKLAPQPPLRKSSSKTSKSEKKESRTSRSKELLSSRKSRDKAQSSGHSSKKSSKTKLSGSSKDNLARKSSLKKVSMDLFDSPSNVQSVSSFVPLGLSNSSGRLEQSDSYALEPQSRGQRSRSRSREVMALPIEIPDSVTDEDAFRHYLTVRRGAYTDIRPHIDFEDDQPSYESVGGDCPRRLPAAMALNSKMSSYQAGVESNKRTSTLSYAIMTLALLSASASQLRFLVRYSKAHSYPVLNYFLICLCIIIEIIVGIGYVILSRFNFSERRVELVQSYLIAGLFIVAIANVIIAAFAFDDHVCEILAKQTLIVTDGFDTVDQ